MIHAFDRRVRSLLERSGKVDPAQLEQIAYQASRDRIPLAQAVTERGLVDERTFVGLIAREARMPPVDLETIEPDPDVLALVDAGTAEEHGVLPLARIGGRLTVALGNPFDVPMLDDLEARTSCELRPVVVSWSAVRRAVTEAYRKNEQQMQQLLGHSDDAEIELKEEGSDAESLDLSMDGEDDSKIVRAANMLLYEAVTQKASDIHVEPFERMSRVRYRKDGLLQESHTFSKAVHTAIVSRIKIMASLDIAEKRRPQDGKFQIKVNGRQVDLRVSILPTVHGEKAVMRVLDSGNLVLRIDDLGFEPECAAAFRKSILEPHGMILVTGPTGSGKSTTLYSTVNELLTAESNFVTVEDPVEYQIEGVNQVPVNIKRGLTFAAALRSILRQDPDVVMVGEIRDQETLDIAVKAALTGHLVLSTLHTNDAPSAVTRMIQMGIDPFLVASSLVMVAAQRLVRKLCMRCRKPTETDHARLVELGFPAERLASAIIYRAEGCSRCTQGYSGRFALLEVLEMSDEVKRIILRSGSETEIGDRARAEGMVSLRTAAIRNVLRGQTSIEEMLRVTGSNRGVPSHDA